MNKGGDDKKPISPARLTIEELYDSYPTLLRRGFTEDILKSLVEWDIIGGILPEGEDQVFFLFKESIERFLDYQDAHYDARITAVDLNIELIKERRSREKAKRDEK